MLAQGEARRRVDHQQVRREPETRLSKATFRFTARAVLNNPLWGEDFYLKVGKYAWSFENHAMIEGFADDGDWKLQQQLPLQKVFKKFDESIKTVS